MLRARADTGRVVLERLDSIPDAAAAFISGPSASRAILLDALALAAQEKGERVVRLDLSGVPNDVRVAVIGNVLLRDPDLLIVDGVDDTDHDALGVATAVAVIGRVLVGVTGDVRTFCCRRSFAPVNDQIAGFYVAA